MSVYMYICIKLLVHPLLNRCINEKKLFFPSYAFSWCKLHKQTSVNGHEAQPSPNACRLLSWSFLLFLTPTFSQSTLCTWISHSFIKIIPSLLSKLTSDVFLPLRIHSVCPPAPSAIISSLDLFIPILCIWIKLSSFWGIYLAFHALMEGYFHVQECRTRRIQAKKKIFSNSILKFQL